MNSLAGTGVTAPSVVGGSGGVAGGGGGGADGGAGAVVGAGVAELPAPSPPHPASKKSPAATTVDAAKYFQCAAPLARLLPVCQVDESSSPAPLRLGAK